jgi:hypothetical protein
MQPLKYDSAGSRIDLSPNELLCVNNVLNEVCHGFRVPDFPARIGVTRDEAVRLLGKVHAVGERVWGAQVWDASLAAHRAQIDLADRDLVTIRNALSETLRELGVEEFETRVGVSFEEGQARLRDLDGLMEGMRRY